MAIMLYPMSSDVVMETLQKPPQETVGHHLFQHQYVLGKLDLSAFSSDYPVIFQDCVFTGPVIFSQASFPVLTLTNCHVESPCELDGSCLAVTDGELNLRGYRGRLNLTHAHIRDNLRLEGAELTTTDGYALDASGIHIDGDLYFSGTGVDEEKCLESDATFVAHAGVLLIDARIGGSVYAREARFEAPHHALHADGIEVRGSLDATGMEASGQVRFNGADISRSFMLTGAAIERYQKPGEKTAEDVLITLDRASIGGSVFCGGGFYCRGGMSARGCRIGASMFFRGASIGEGDGTSGGTESTDRAALSLDRCTIEAKLSFTGCKVDECTGPCHSVKAVERARRFSGGMVPFSIDGGFLSLVGANVKNEIAIDVGGISGDLSGERKVAVDLARVGTDILKITAQGLGPHPREDKLYCIDFTQAKVRVFYDEETVWKYFGSVLTQFRYEQLGDPIADRRKWVKNGASRSWTMKRGNPTEKIVYEPGPPSPEPYERLSAVYDAAGNHREARVIRLREKRDENGYRRRKLLKGDWRQIPSYLWNLLQDLFIGYGYAPFKAFSILLVTWLAAVGIFYGVPPKPVGVNHSGLQGMSFLEHFTYPADLLVPLIGLGEKNDWHPQPGWTEVVAAVLVALGWILGATVIAAVTRVVRRP